MPSQVSGHNERGLRLLSIDGGGIRGLSPLLMLREILYRIQQAKQLQDLPRPCDFFDLAGGTSTGGLIVIMLFRLQMSIDEAIDTYATLARSVFSEKKWFFQEGTFRASRLEDAIISIIRVRSNKADGDPRAVKMLNEDGPKCFVCAMLAGNLRFPTLFRSWLPPSNQNYNCSIVQAARATTAAPTFFKAIEFGHPTAQRYLDGGLQCNNPVKYVVEEARSLYPDRAISCVLSLGTGTTGVIGLERPDAFQNMLPTKLVGVLRAIATDCNEQSEAMARQLYQRDKPNSYFRLNVNEGLHNVSLAEWSRLNEVETHTVQYLRTNDVGQKVDQLVELLKADGPVSETALNLPTRELSPTESKALDELKKAISHSAFHDSRARSTSSRCMPGTRLGQIERITHWIEMAGEKKPLFIVLGPAGSGKTALLNTMALTCTEKGYCAGSFFFSGTDADRNNDACLVSTITYQIAEAIPELRPYVAQAIENQPSILNRSLESQARSLLLEPLRQLRCNYPAFSFHPRVVIIDALDECGKLEDQGRVIAMLGEVLSDESFPFICLLSSRFNPHIEHEISTTLTAHIHDQVILGKDGDAERADIRTYLHANIDRIRKKHTFGNRIPKEWPLESDLETIVKRSGGQFIYASTVIQYVGSPKHNPHERLRYVLGISSTIVGEDPFAELDALYLALMSSVENLVAAIEILGVALVRSSSQFWMPELMKFFFDFNEHFRSLDGDIVLAPLASVLKYEDGRITFYHLSFAEFLLDSTRSQEYFVQLINWQKRIVSRLVPFFYDRLCRATPTSYLLLDTLYLIEEAKPGTDLHQAIDDGIALVTNHPKRLHSVGNYNIWPFVTFGFVVQLQFNISIDKLAHVFFQRGNFLPLPILIKLASATSLSNSFLLFELCRTFAELQKLRFIEPHSFPPPIGPGRLSILMTYLAHYLDDQHRLGQEELLPNDYLSALLRCLWYLQSSSRNIRSSLMEQLSRLDPNGAPDQLGTSDYLNDGSSNLTRGALDALPLLLPHATPSINLLAVLKRPFNTEVLMRTPSSSHKALCIIHDYLVQHDPEYQQGKHIYLAGKVGSDEPLSEFGRFLHRKRM